MAQDKGVPPSGSGHQPSASASQEAVFAESHPSREWTPYADRRPATEGIYEWRVPSVAVPGIVVRVLDHMRERGAGFERVLSPSFDYWNGYSVSVPKGLEWRETTEGADLKSYQSRLLGVDGVEFEPCPFCRHVPTLKALIGGFGQGVSVSDDPHRYNNWWLECCSWARTPHFRDPRELQAKRSALLRDTDGSPKGRDAQRLDGEAATAGAVRHRPEPVGERKEEG